MMMMMMDDDADDADDDGDDDGYDDDDGDDDYYLKGFAPCRQPPSPFPRRLADGGQIAVNKIFVVKHQEDKSLCTKMPSLLGLWWPSTGTSS